MEFYVILLPILLVIIAVKLLFNGSRRKLNLPPGPRGLPFLGYLPWMPLTYVEQQALYAKLRKKYGSIVSFRVGKAVFVIISDSNLIQQASRSSSLMGRYNGQPEDVMPPGDYGIAQSNGKKWETNRQYLLRKWHEHGVGTTIFDDVLKKQIDALMEKLSECGREEKAFLISDAINVLQLNASFGVVTNKTFYWYDKRVQGMIAESRELMDKLTANHLFASLPTWLREVLKIIYKKRVDYYKEKWRTFLSFFQELVRDDIAHKRNLAFDCLMETEEKDQNCDSGKLTEFEMVILILELFIAATHSPCAALKWTIICLARYQNFQQAAQKQLDDVVGKGNLPAIGDRKRLPFISALISESLRTLGSPTVSIEHVALEDMKIGMYDIPKGAYVIADLKSMHSDPNLWKTGDRFDPENFLDEDGNYFVPKVGYLPFGCGKRSCVGESITKHQLFLFVATLLHRFKFRIPDGEIIQPMTVGTVNEPKPFEMLVEERI